MFLIRSCMFTWHHQSFGSFFFSLWLFICQGFWVQLFEAGGSTLRARPTTPVLHPAKHALCNGVMLHTLSYLTAASSPSSQCVINKDFDWGVYGSEYTTAPGAADAASCCAACRKDEKCWGWVWFMVSSQLYLGLLVSSPNTYMP